MKEVDSCKLVAFNCMSPAQLNVELEKGYADIAASCIHDIHDVVAKMENEMIADAVEQNEELAMNKMKDAIRAMREQSAMNGNVNMSIDEINVEISKCRQEKRVK
ncbi:MAG: hypothetical protein FWC71_07655 [Defluviitaleaceae bacterium]|nr:hypothetical protein [Defluviitaleaceae bacterium]